MTKSGISSKRLGEKIRKVRDLRGFSQEYMATTLGISTRTYGRIESGTGPDPDRLEEIAGVLEIPVLDLMSFDEKLFFNHCNQSYTYASQNTYHEASSKLLEQYEQRIEHLSEEVGYLRKQLEAALKKD